MDGIINIFNAIFEPIMAMGSSVVLILSITIIGLIFRVKFSKSLEGAIKLAIALAGMGAVIGILTSAFAPPLEQLSNNMGVTFPIVDLGWAPLATITWASTYTLYFLGISILVNFVMLKLDLTDTLDVDIFNIWHVAFTGLLVLYFGGGLLITTIVVIILCMLKLRNADLLKPQFNYLVDMDESNPTTTTHTNFLLAPIANLFDHFLRKIKFLDRIDFDAAKMNEKLGFWGSKFAIGIYLGLFVGILAKLSIPEIVGLAMSGAVALELFSLVGQWFISALDPISGGITNVMSKKFVGRKFNIGIDWPFLASRAEIWAVANIMAPIMLIMAFILPGNEIIPLGGIIAMGLTPALLVVTDGKMIRMLIIGVICIPLTLYSATIIAPMVTNLATQVGAMPTDIPQGTMISHSTMENPYWLIMATQIGKLFKDFATSQILIVLSMIGFYSGCWVLYEKDMKAKYLKRK